MRMLPGGFYDVGAITKEIQRSFNIFRRPLAVSEKNSATPEHLRVLLDKLSSLTDSIQEKRTGLSDWLPDAGVLHWDQSMAAWEGRLLLYREAVRLAEPDDRQAVLWNVTAPLILGFQGGPDSKRPQTTIDAITPFTLANQLKVDAGWRTERWDEFQNDLKKGLEWWAVAIPVTLGLLVIYTIVRK